MLYNKYRPNTFTQIVGQEPVVRTIRNAIILDRVPHTFLFEGLRGTGKTTRRGQLNGWCRWSLITSLRQ